MLLDQSKLSKLTEAELADLAEFRRRYWEDFKYMRANTIAINDEFDPWTDEQSKELTQLFKEGWDISSIAVFLHRTEPAVMNQIRALHLYGRRGP